MHNYRTVGFNSISYDLNVIWLAYKYQDAGLLKDATNDLILNNFRKKELTAKYNFQVFKNELLQNNQRNDTYFVDEGGYGTLGAKGAATILVNEKTNSYSHIIFFGCLFKANGICAASYWQ
jgi:hypothetical protein